MDSLVKALQSSLMNYPKFQFSGSQAIEISYHVLDTILSDSKIRDFEDLEKLCKLLGRTEVRGNDLIVPIMNETRLDDSINIFSDSVHPNVTERKKTAPAEIPQTLPKKDDHPKFHLRKYNIAKWAKTVMIGDSNFRFFSPHDIGQSVQVFTNPGKTIDYIKCCIESLPPQPHVTKVVLHAGINDLNPRDQSTPNLDDLSSPYANLIQAATEKFPSATIHVSSVLPLRGNTALSESRQDSIECFNGMLQSLTESHPNWSFVNNSVIFKGQGKSLYRPAHIKDEMHLDKNYGVFLFMRNVLEKTGLRFPYSHEAMTAPKQRINAEPQPHYWQQPPQQQPWQPPHHPAWPGPQPSPP